MSEVERIVQEWLDYAENDYTVAKTLLETQNERCIGAICFHCQQSIEKLMKAVLILKDQPAPKSHDLSKLNELMAAAHPEWEVSLLSLETLNKYAVESRYPGELPTWPETEEAFAICSALRERLLALF